MLRLYGRDGGKLDGGRGGCGLGNWLSVVLFVSVSAPSWTCLFDVGLGSFLEFSFNDSDARDGGASSLVCRRAKDLSEGAKSSSSSSMSIDELLDLGSKSSLSP